MPLGTVWPGAHFKRGRRPDWGLPRKQSGLGHKRLIRKELSCALGQVICEVPFHLYAQPELTFSVPGECFLYFARECEFQCERPDQLRANQYIVRREHQPLAANCTCAYAAITNERHSLRGVSHLVFVNRT
jgi:hypothetical protein